MSNSTTAGVRPPGQRLEFLDSLRGLAAVYVVLYHMLLMPEPDLGVPRWAQMFALNGGTGVTLFFVVSAFSLCLTMPARLAEARPVLSFYLHRLLRIAPLFYVLMVVSWIRDAYIFGVFHRPMEVLGMATFVFNLVPGAQESFVWAGWTIGVEMVFYALFPLLYVSVRTLHGAISLFFGFLMLWMAAGLALDYLTLSEAAEQSIRQWSALRHFPIFALGIAGFHLHSHLQSKTDQPARCELGNALVAGGAFLYVALLNGWLPQIFGDGYYWQGVVYVTLMLGVSLAPWRFIVNRMTRYLGEVSYSMYLWHPLVVAALVPVYRQIYAALPSLTLAFLCSFFLTLVVLLPLSTLSYRLVEKPGIRFGRSLANRLGWSQRVPLTPA